MSRCVGRYQGYTHLLGATQQALLRKREKTTLDIVKADKDSRASIHRIGKRVPQMRADLRNTEKFVCSLYNDIKSCNVNDTKYKLFCKSQNPQSHQIPSTHAVLQKHLQCANYQSLCLEHALDARILNQEPDGQGWQVSGEELEID